MSKHRWLLVAVFVLALVACVLWFPCTILDGEGWMRSASSISTVGAALRTYHEDHGRLPPAVVTSKDGRPLYSWRVLLPPYLDLEMAEQFKRDEPWDSPQNKKLLARTPNDFKPFLGGVDAPGLTRYQVLVGPGVSGRSKPATDGRLKTSHFEETQFVQVALSVRPVPLEAHHVQSAQSGHDRHHLISPSARIKASEASRRPFSEH